MTVVAAAHVEPPPLDRAAALASAAAWVEEAGRRSVDVLGFPESFVGGFPYWVNTAPPGEAADLFADLYREAVPTEDLAAVLAPVVTAARDTGVSVVLGLTERQGGTLFNAQAMVDAATGAVPLVRRKLVPTGGERAVWGHGDASTLHAVDLGGVRVSAMMCFEHVMGLARHALATEQAQVHVAAWPGLDGLRGYGAGAFHRQVDLLSASHALMAQAVVVSAMNPVTARTLDRLHAVVPDRGLLGPCSARSTVLGPSGQVLAEQEGPDERLVVADVDLASLIPRAKRLVDVGHFGRPECLSLTITRTPFSSAHTPHHPVVEQ